MAKKKPTQSKKGKGKASTEEPVITRVKFPSRKMGEMFGRVTDILGNDRMRVFCEDGKSRIGRIRGKIKKRVWIRQGDLIIVNPWDFEDDKCEISWRYTSAEIQWLERNRKIPEILDINRIPL
ncbi:MAG: translation initiation factor eIF-1A [Candidatus Lokiarchaeota archaeon]|nr:translation initiation factor eIF-1A [Candidatus Lokiarchaeota archaeon]